MLAAAGLLVVWSSDDMVVVVALLLLGLGWSAVLVGASALLTGAAPEEHRAGLQGRSDVAMNVTGALGGVVAGPVVSTFGMPVMAGIVIALVVGQLVVSALLRRRAGQQGQPSRIHGGTRAH